MKIRLIPITAVVVLLPSLAAGQPYTAYNSRFSAPERGRYECQVIGCTEWGRHPPPPKCTGGCDSHPDLDATGVRPWSLAPQDSGDFQGYYRDYVPAPQYGYTYGSARGRGYGHSYGDYRGLPPYPGEW